VLAAKLRFATVLCVFVAFGAFAASSAGALGAGGFKGNDHSFSGAISGDGRFIAFATVATNLDPLDTDAASDVYVRDLDTGFTQLVSRATGAAGAKGNLSSGTPSISADGRYVAFDSVAQNLVPEDADFIRDVYVRDLQTNTTTLVSRASGVAGAKGNDDSLGPSISASGTRVAFESTAGNLASDGDGISDIFVRDLAGNTTTLASRATGAAGVKGNDFSSEAAISGDGTRVAFTSIATNLGSGDADALEDVHVRNLTANTTTLASRATGASGAKGNGDSGGPALSGDGSIVAFHTTSTNLNAADTDTTHDVYVRSLASNTTTLESRATGVSGDKGNSASVGPVLDGDGTTVAFGSGATNLSTDDFDSLRDAYVRDRTAATTTLVSRGAGALGAKANGDSGPLGLSSDAHHVLVSSSANNLSVDDPDTREDQYVRDTQTAFMSLESRGTPNYARPKAATPMFIPMVIAYQACASPNRAHAPPLSHASCEPPVPASGFLTAGTADANGQAANMVGSVRYRVVNGDPGTPADEADVELTVDVTDVRSQGTLADYTGELAVDATMRITDRLNGSPGAGTVQDIGFPVPAGCTATPDPAVGSTCSIATTLDAVMPGAAPEGARSVWQVGQVQVSDGGADGLAATAPNDVFLRQGVFIP